MLFVRTFFQALDRKTTQLNQKQVSDLAFHLIFHHFSQLNCCLSVVLQLDIMIKGITLKISKLCFCPNKQCVFYLRRRHQKNNCCMFGLSRLDYCNSLLVGCAKYFLSKLQKVQNNAARLIFRTTRSAHITPMLHSLHWLPTEWRIEYKLSLLCFNVISHQAPIYLSELLHLYTPFWQLCSSTDT